MALLEYLHLPYTCRRVEPGEWEAEKTALVAQGFLLANLPYLRSGDSLLAESSAILRRLCTHAGRTDLLPEAEEEDRFNELSGAVAAFKDATTPPFYTSTSPTQLLQELAPALAALLPPFVALLSQRSFLFGRLTWLDFPFAENIDMLLTAETELGGALFEDGALLRAYVDRLAGLEGVDAYRASPHFAARPFNASFFGAVWH